MKRSFYVNSSISRINGNSYHGLPFQQKSFKKQKPMINNNSTTKQIISGCNLVESIMEGKWFSVDYQMQYFSMVWFVSLCYCAVIMPYVRAIFFLFIPFNCRSFNFASTFLSSSFHSCNCMFLIFYLYFVSIHFFLHFSSIVLLI